MLDTIIIGNKVYKNLNINKILNDNFKNNIKFNIHPF